MFLDFSPRLLLLTASTPAEGQTFPDCREGRSGESRGPVPGVLSGSLARAGGSCRVEFNASRFNQTWQLSGARVQGQLATKMI